VSAVVIACLGNPDRADDGIGPVVADELRRADPVPGNGSVPGQRLATVLAGTDPVALLDLPAGVAILVVVDAVRSGAAPGTVSVRELTDRTGPAAAPASGHVLAVHDVLGVLRGLGRAPARAVLVGIAADCFTPGAPICPAVDAAGPVAVRMVGELLAGHATPAVIKKFVEPR
jgi:hydrogenase maturation protease